MAPSIDASEHIRFLVNCIKNTKDGKPDFQAVADDLNIVSKAAAAKRYERLLKANDVATSGVGSASSPAKKEPAVPNKPKPPTTPRKRGASAAIKAEEGTAPPAKRLRARRGGKAMKKEEAEASMKTSESDKEEAKPLKPSKATKAGIKKAPDSSDDEKVIKKEAIKKEVVKKEVAPKTESSDEAEVKESTDYNSDKTSTKQEEESDAKVESDSD